MPSVSPRASQLRNPAALWLWGLGKLLHLPEAVLWSVEPCAGLAWVSCPRGDVWVL